MKRIKVGLVGVSGYGAVHFRNWRALAEKGEIEFAAAAVINPEQVPEELAVLGRLGAKVFPTAEAMFDEMKGKLDVISLPVGIAFHERLTLQALASGANVLVEKPAASSNAAVARMMTAEQASGRFVAVGFQQISGREVQFIKQYLVSGRLGKVRRITCTGIWPRADQYYSRNNWAGKLLAADGTPIWDSPINNAFAHYLNLELFFAGDEFEESAHAISVEGALYRARKTIETFDTCTLRFRTANEVEILCLLTHASAAKVDPIIQVECENGEVSWQLNGTWSIRSGEGRQLYSGIVELPVGDMFKDVLRKASGKQVFCCPLSVAAEHANCIEMLMTTLSPIDVTASVTRVPENGQLLLAGVEKVFAECMQNHCLPAELPPMQPGNDDGSSSNCATPAQEWWLRK